jgi:hypothetical protein
MKRQVRFTQALSVDAAMLLPAASFPSEGFSPGEIVWTSTGGPEGGNIIALAIDPAIPTTLYAGTAGGVFRAVESTAP